MILALTVFEKVHSKPSKAAFLSIFRHNFRWEADNDVIYGVAVDYVNVNVPVKFGDSRSNGSRDIRGAVCRSKVRANA